MTIDTDEMRRLRALPENVEFWKGYCCGRYHGPPIAIPELVKRGFLPADAGPNALDDTPPAWFVTGDILRRESIH